MAMSRVEENLRTTAVVVDMGRKCGHCTKRAACAKSLPVQTVQAVRYQRSGLRPIRSFTPNDPTKDCWKSHFKLYPRIAHQA
ncbi:hypothetical protein BFW01_g11164 [Lasiodiplodia theobromae]|nr:hypothetical protein BFW01_g11164 [Lasiodiplodia theobromae]